MKHNRSAKLLGAATLLGAALLLCAFMLALPAAAAAPDSTRVPDGAAPSSAPAAKPRPALWARAVEVFEANKNLMPGRMFQKVQELNDDGRAKSESNAEISLGLDGEGKIKSDILKATKDGKDVTAEERKKAEEREKKEAAREAKRKRDAQKNDGTDAKSGSGGDSKEHSHSISSGDNPFNADMQNDVSIMETGSRETIDGRSCVRFTYSYPARREKPSKGKPVAVKGTAWIEESTGNPVKIEFTNDPLPRGAKSMLTTFHYAGGANGSWILERMEFEASGSFLFFKKRIRGDITFGEYWIYEEPASQE